MPADTLTVSIPAPLADDVRAAAQAAGLTPEEYVRQQLAEDVTFDAEADLLDWEEDIRRLEEPGANVSLDDAFDRLDAKVSDARKSMK